MLSRIGPQGRPHRKFTQRAMSERDRPIIGITSYAESSVRWGVWDVPAAVIPLAYVDAIERAGGRPLLVPPSEEGLEETLAAVDGLLFSGGSDLDPAAYGQEAHPQTVDVRPERDRGELALLEAALERDLPVLAVCRGSQVLNVARGGDLVQHLPDVVGDDKHKHTPGVFADHQVSVRAESRLGALFGDRAPVKSHHHQGFGQIGTGLVEAAWAEDGTVEAIEDPNRRFAVGVLWHPEEGEDAALFQALVFEARAYRAAARGT
jgi:putative glutamine amidotransferase